jgi:hypothetical protein
MNDQNKTIPNYPGNFGRRRFLSSCAACLGCIPILPYATPNFFPSESKDGKIRIRVIYSLHSAKQDKPDWPNVGFDFNPAMQNINNLLEEKLQDFEFLPTMATGPEDAAKIIKIDASENIDGYLVYQMNCWNKVIQAVSETGKPVLYADFQFGGSGGFLVYNASFIRNNKNNVAFVASSDLNELVDAVACFRKIRQGSSISDFQNAVSAVRYKNTPAGRNLKMNADDLKLISPEECVNKMKTSKILAVRDTSSGSSEPVAGIPVEKVSFAELNAAWNTANKDLSLEVMDQWKRNASAIIGVEDKTLEASAAMYVGMKEVLKIHNANAITVNCLGGFYGGHIHAYPCLGFHQLCNEGLIGACECDINSTATMVTFNALTNGRPGFISDPVVDTSKRQIIYAHCVASNKVFGPEGTANPFSIMTHSEDRQGASIRSILPEGYMTTTLEINSPRKEILLHLAKAVANDPDDRACRTKLCGEPVGDIEKLFTQWDKWSWHRVTFYGNLKEPVYELAKVMGYSVVEEA